MSEDSTPGAAITMSGAELGKAIAEGIAGATPRKVTFGEFARRPDPIYHPLGKQGPQMKRPYFQNGVKLEYASTHDKEIALLNRITHSGRYIDRLVEVVVAQDGADDTIDIRFSNKTPDMQIELKGHCRNFLDMLQQIVDAQEMEDLEEEERKSTSKPGRVSVPKQFGNSKATQAAYDAANSK
jgi:hypothetical protein